MKRCKVDECERPSRSNTMCTMHHSRWRRTGSTDHSRPDFLMTTEERFWAKVNKTATCWEWTGAKGPQGHGVFRTEDGKTMSAYRWLWEKVNGPVPAGLVLDHIACDNPPCVNPAHLKPATIGENVLRGLSTAANHARQTHCLRGHPLSGDNLKIIIRHTRNGGEERVCRECTRIRNARRSKGSADNGSGSVPLAEQQ